MRERWFFTNATQTICSTLIRESEAYAAKNSHSNRSIAIPGIVCLHSLRLDCRSAKCQFVVCNRFAYPAGAIVLCNGDKTPAQLIIDRAICYAVESHERFQVIDSAD
jgi:hypothetical protein